MIEFLTTLIVVFLTSVIIIHYNNKKIKALKHHHSEELNKSRTLHLKEIEAQSRTIYLLKDIVDEKDTWIASRQETTEKQEELITKLRSEKDSFRNELKEDFEKWKKDFIAIEKPKIRKDSLKRSDRIARGFAIENLAPLIQSEYSPKDFRHFGDPIDYIVFDGLSELQKGDISELRNVVFLDIKTGNSRLNTVQRRVRDAINDGRVSFKVYNPDKES
jgi:predicted Holliday junction resolvase-like endonuclease